jgi:sucrose synthase
MKERIQSSVQDHRDQLLNLLQRYVALGRTILQPHHLVDELTLQAADERSAIDIKTTAFGKLIENCQEAIVSPPWVGFAVRPKPGIWEYVRINVEELVVEELSVSEYLSFKEQLIGDSKYSSLTLSASVNFHWIVASFQNLYDI